MSAILYRKLNQPGNDPQYGQGISNFLSDLDAVAQIIYTKLQLLRGELFSNIGIGTPVFQSILGVPNTNAAVAFLLRQQIVSVPFVLSVSNLNISYVGSTRAYSFSCDVQTAFGKLSINNQPLPGTSAILTN